MCMAPKPSPKPRLCATSGEERTAIKVETEAGMEQDRWVHPQVWLRGEQAMPSVSWVMLLLSGVTLWPGLPGMVPM